MGSESVTPESQKEQKPVTIWPTVAPIIIAPTNPSHILLNITISTTEVKLFYKYVYAFPADEFGS